MTTCSRVYIGLNQRTLNLSDDECQAYVGIVNLSYSWPPDVQYFEGLIHSDISLVHPLILTDYKAKVRNFVQTQRANVQVNEGLANVSVITTEINLLSTLLKRLT